MAEPFTVMSIIHASKEYDLITEFYAGKSAKRSGRPYMAHIDEGLSYMAERRMSARSMKAFCLHPLFQADEDLTSWNQMVAKFPHWFAADVMILVMEYRRVANSFLVRHYEDMEGTCELSPLSEVNDMLRADKVQNYSDFLRFHFGKHERSRYLDGYFKTWLDRLDVTYRVVKIEDPQPFYVLEVK